MATTTMTMKDFLAKPFYRSIEDGEQTLVINSLELKKGSKDEYFVATCIVDGDIPFNRNLFVNDMAYVCSGIRSQLFANETMAPMDILKNAIGKELKVVFSHATSDDGKTYQNISWMPAKKTDNKTEDNKSEDNQSLSDLPF